MTTLTALEQRLAQATAGSRELDVDITEACGLAPPGYMPLHKAIGHVRGVPQNHMKLTTFINPDDPPMRKTWEPPLLTANLDAALAFCAAVLPECNGEISWSFGEISRGGYAELNGPNPLWQDEDCPASEMNRHAYCVSSYESENDPHEERSVPKPRPLALALVLATVRALIGKEQAT